MRKMCFLKIFIIILFIFNGFHLFSDEVDDFKVGICRFDESVSNSESLADGVLAIFYETISRLEFHAMDKEELENYFKKEIIKKINTEKKGLEDLFVKRDDIVFESSRLEWNREFEKLEEEIFKKKEEIRLLEQDLEDIRVDEIKLDAVGTVPIELKNPDNSMYYEKNKGI